MSSERRVAVQRGQTIDKLERTCPKSVVQIEHVRCTLQPPGRLPDTWAGSSCEFENFLPDLSHTLIETLVPYHCCLADYWGSSGRRGGSVSVSFPCVSPLRKS